MIAVGIAGDLNGNGRLDVLDARQVITAVHGNPDALKMLALDVNGNDRADALDARQIFSAVLGEGLTW